MKIASGATNAYLHFVAFSTADHVSRVTGLTSFNVYIAASSASTGSTMGVTVGEVNSTQMPGVYRLQLADSSAVTVGSGFDTREFCVHITSSMDPVTRTYEVYRPTQTTGTTLTVDSSGAVNANMVEIAGSAPSTGTAHFGVNVVTLTNNSITAASIATDAGSEIADAILDRDMATGTDTATTDGSVRTPRQALRFLRNKWSVSGTALTVYKEDDATASWTATITASTAASPVVGSDPAGP